MPAQNELRECELFATGSAEQVGRDVLGPIFAEFAQRLWLFQEFLPHGENACLLFCARGGFRLRLIYERFLMRTGLQSRLPFADFMVSRLVAARAPFAAPGPALHQELAREFEGQTMAEVVQALAQDRNLARSALWQQPFEIHAFFALLDCDAPDAAQIRDTIAQLDLGFRRHLEAITDNRSIIVLCDTGLYGSTVRLLSEGIPEKTWIAAQFARSNYKRFETPHFPMTVGLSVEHDGYLPWNARTAVLRFWHLIESTLEPDLPSVRTFDSANPPQTNLEIPNWQDRIAADKPGLFFGVMAHLDSLSSADLTNVSPRAKTAWLRLRRHIIWPRPQDVIALTLGSPRARDFGRDQDVHQFPEKAPIQASLWREGALVQRYPWRARVALLLLETLHIGRTLRRLGRKLR